jgi:hypothetical protein
MHKPKEALNKLIPFKVRQAHHERNHALAVRPEPVEGRVQCFPERSYIHRLCRRIVA